MKRFFLLFIAFISQIYAFAQKGRVRPIDLGEGVSHNSDDYFYLFLSFIGIIIIVIIYRFIQDEKTVNKPKQPHEPSLFFKAIKGMSDIYTIIVTGGCLIGMVVAPIVLLIISVKDCANDSSNKQKKQVEQRQEKTIVDVIYSDTDYKQSHIALENEFTGEDTVFYYKSDVYQNKTGKTLAIYSVEYSINGSKTLEVIKTISPDTYFDTGYRYIIPFIRPRQSVEITIPSGNSRWGRSYRTKATRTVYFIDYLENVNSIAFSLNADIHIR